MVKFLIIQTAFIGDVILATPLIEKLHHFYPDSQIDFLLRKGNENLLRNHPYVDNIIVWNKKQNKIKNLLKVIKRIRQKKYDYAMNLQRFASSGIITAFSGAKLKAGFNKNPFSFAFSRSFKHEIGNGKHEVERNLQLIEEITDASFYKPKLYPPRKILKLFRSTKCIRIFVLLPHLFGLPSSSQQKNGLIYYK